MVRHGVGRCVVVLSGMLALSGAALGQQAGAGQADPSSTMLVMYQQEMDALGAMSGSMGPMVVAAQERIKLMKEFISDQKLEGDWANFTPISKAASFSSLTFNQALQTAFDHQKNMAPKAPASNDMSTMAAEVQATQTLVHKQWNRLNDLHQQVETMTAFLTSKDKLKDYKAWAMEQADAQAKQASEARAAHLAAEKAHYEHQQQLRKKWDEQQHQQMLATIAASNQRMAGGGGGQTSGGASAGSQDASGSSDEAQDYYAGSYWNGYADPYYACMAVGRRGPRRTRTRAIVGTPGTGRVAGVARDRWVGADRRRAVVGRSARGRVSQAACRMVAGFGSACEAGCGWSSDASASTRWSTTASA